MISKTVVIILGTGFMIGSSQAIQCFTCQNQANNCISGIMTTCPESYQFCKFDWEKSSDFTEQTCAQVPDCQSNPFKNVFPGKTIREGDGYIGDVSFCCDFDGCNCVANQCDFISSTSPIPNSTAFATISIGTLFISQLIINFLNE